MLAERLEVEKKVKALEQKRAEKRKQIFEATDEVERMQAELISKMEAQLHQQSHTQELFTIRWTLEAPPSR